MLLGDSAPSQGFRELPITPKQYLNLILKYLCINTVSPVYCSYSRKKSRANMTKQNDNTPLTSQPGLYQIRIEGHLDAQWTDWFSGLAVTLEDNGYTLLAGPVADQSALFGLLKKVRDLGMPLVSVNRVDPESTPRKSNPETLKSRRRKNNDKEK